MHLWAFVYLLQHPEMSKSERIMPKRCVNTSDRCRRESSDRQAIGTPCASACAPLQHPVPKAHLFPSRRISSPSGRLLLVVVLLLWLLVLVLLALLCVSSSLLLVLWGGAPRGDPAAERVGSLVTAGCWEHLLLSVVLLAFWVWLLTLWLAFTLLLLSLLTLWPPGAGILETVLASITNCFGN